MSSASRSSSSAAAFLYLALKPGGGRSLGLREARNAAALAQSLRGENRLVLKAWRLWATTEPTLSLQDQQSLNEQLAQLLSRGVPLVEALGVVVQTVRPTARPRLSRLKDLVASGTSFADACKNVGGFDNVTIAVYRGAERTGDLGTAAKELQEAARRRLAVANKALTLMMYPAIVLSISFFVCGFMMMYVVPMMAEGLTKNGIELPMFSKIVMGAGVWMHGHALWLAAALAAVAIGVIIGRASAMKWAQAVMRKLPKVRDVVLAQESARFFSVMAAMTRTGVPIAEALGVANQAIGHPKMRWELDRLRNRLIEGGLLRALIDEVTTLPLATRRLMTAAERSGDLESAFGTLAQDMTASVDTTSGRLLALLEPALIVCMFLIIGTLLLALMLPMLTLTNSIH